MNTLWLKTARFATGMIGLGLMVAFVLAGEEKKGVATKIGEGIQTKSDGIFVLDTGKKGKKLIVEQSWDGDARIWEYKSGKWKSEEIYKGLGQCFSPLVFDFSGKDDYSIYVGSWSKRAGVYQIPLSKSGKPSKDIEVIPNSNVCGSILCLRAGDARNDGKNRLYVGSEGKGGGIYEFTRGKSNKDWTSLKIHDGSVGEFAIGDVHGDKIQRIYAGDRGGKLYEFTWTNGSWQKEEIPIPASDVKTVAIGDGRGDGKKRLYVNAGNNSYEIEFRNGKWDSKKVGRPGTRYYFASTPASDGKARVYSSLQGVGFFEWFWKDGEYQENQIDAVTSATGGIAIGDGRGDGIRRVYVTNGDRQKTGSVIWELPVP